MGSWNKTCGLTNLHIRAGDKAYVFVLEKNCTSNNHCYSTHLYRPLLLPFETTYNDYGGGKDSKGPAFPLIIDGIKQQLFEMEQGKNPYHDIPVLQENFDEELFFDALLEGRLFLKNRITNPVKLEFVMMRKDIVDDILENRWIECYVGDNEGNYDKYKTGRMDYHRYKFADIAADVLPMLRGFIERHKGDEEIEQRLPFFSVIRYISNYDQTNLAFKWLHTDHYQLSNIVSLDKVLQSALTSIEAESNVLKLEPLLIEAIKGRFINDLMGVTRRSWMPQAGEGSQCAEIDEYRLINAAMSRAMDIEDTLS